MPLTRIDGEGKAPDLSSMADLGSPTSARQSTKSCRAVSRCGHPGRCKSSTLTAIGNSAHRGYQGAFPISLRVKPTFWASLMKRASATVREEYAGHPIDAGAAPEADLNARSTAASERSRPLPLPPTGPHEWMLNPVPE